MSYCILRTAKLSTLGNVAGSGAHNYREQVTPNADPKRTPKNQHIGAKSADELVQRVKARLPVDARKNAVVCIEYMIGMSPEAMQMPGFNHMKYLNDSLNWLRSRHGADNVVASSIHLDEKTPHLIAYVVPLSTQPVRKPRGKDREGEPKFETKLNARRFLGGREALSQMQSHFADKVGSKHGLERGVKGSRAEHKTIRAWYGEQARARQIVPEIEEKAVPFSQKVIVDKPKLDELKVLAGTAGTQLSELARFSSTSARAKETEAKAIAQAEAEKRKRAELEAKQRQEIARYKQQIEDLKRAHEGQIGDLHLWVNDMAKINKELLKATANLIKSTPKGELAQMMGVELVGKADIFDAVQKAGMAKTFDDAVILVAKRYNDHFETRISEAAQWVVDYEEAESKFSPPKFGM